MTERHSDKDERGALYELLEDAAEIRVVPFGTDKWRTLTDAEEDCLIRALRPAAVPEYGALPRPSDQFLGRLIQAWFGKEQADDPTPTREGHGADFFVRMRRVYDVMVHAAANNTAPLSTRGERVDAMLEAAAYCDDCAEASYRCGVEPLAAAQKAMAKEFKARAAIAAAPFSASGAIPK